MTVKLILSKDKEIGTINLQIFSTLLQLRMLMVVSQLRFIIMSGLQIKRER